MAVFRYKGVNADGKSIAGTREAENARSLRALLKKDGVLVFEVEEATTQRKKSSADSKNSSNEKASFSKIRQFFREQSAKSAGRDGLPIFTRQLATLLKAGVQLSESLSSLVEQASNPNLKQVLSDIRMQVNEGRSLSSAMGHYPQIFEPLYVSMISVGEAAGNLEVVLFRLAGFLDAQKKLRGKITSALAYPILMIILGSGIMTFLMVSVVPKISALYEDAQQSLPLLTEIVTGISNMLIHYPEFIILGLVLVFGSFFYWRSTPEGRLKLDKMKLRLYVIGPLARMIAVSRFAKTLATMLASGVPLLRAMDIVKDVLGNQVLSKVIEDARGSIREGESIAQPLKRSGQFPAIVCNMIAVGERSGQLETMLENIADAYDVEVEARVARLTSLMEPMMILVMGGSVGTVVLAIMWPIMQMASFAG